MDSSKKVALVTGASRGIGRAIARAFASDDMRVVVHYHRNKDGAEETIDSLVGDGHLLVQASMEEGDSIREMISTVETEMGRIDVLVNNAGIDEKLPILETAYEKWQGTWFRTLKVNVLGPANVTFCVVHHMLKHGGGKIISLSSRGAFRGMPTSPAYSASKAAINAMSQSLAIVLGAHNIFFYVVAPGPVYTDMSAPVLDGPEGKAVRRESPLGRIATLEEVARTILFLASDKTDYLTGCIIDINGASYLRS